MTACAHLSFTPPRPSATVKRKWLFHFSQIPEHRFSFDWIKLQASHPSQNRKQKTMNISDISDFWELTALAVCRALCEFDHLFCWLLCHHHVNTVLLTGWLEYEHLVSCANRDQYSLFHMHCWYSLFDTYPVLPHEDPESHSMQRWNPESHTVCWDLHTRAWWFTLGR